MCVSSKLVFHQSQYINAIKDIQYTRYYYHMYILDFFHVFVHSLLLRCMFKV